jgi:hypothetical protein
LADEVALTVETLVREVQLLLHAALSADLGGEEQPSVAALRAAVGTLALPVEEYVQFLHDNGFVRLADDGTLAVQGRGRAASKGSHDATLFSALTAHFESRLASGELPKRPGAPDAAPSYLLQGRYERRDELGLGTLGAVFRGRAVATGRFVALKEIRHVFHYVAYLSRAELLARLRRAVEEAAGVEHPHVVSILDADLELPFPIVVTELCPGGSLRAQLNAALARGELGLPTDLALSTLWQMAVGVRALHDGGLVHGGLRPENVLYDARANVKLSDAGLARVTERSAVLGGAPVYVGSLPPAYAAPEVLKGGGATPRADLYALGLVLYELLVGDLPARRSPTPRTLRPSLPPVVDELFERLTQVDPEQRPADAGEVLALLRDAVPGGAPPPGRLWLYEDEAAAPQADAAAGLDDDDIDEFERTIPTGPTFSLLERAADDDGGPEGE